MPKKPSRVEEIQFSAKYIYFTDKKKSQFSAKKTQLSVEENKLVPKKFKLVPKKNILSDKKINMVPKISI